MLCYLMEGLQARVEFMMHSATCGPCLEDTGKTNPSTLRAPFPTHIVHPDAAHIAPINCLAFIHCHPFALRPPPRLLACQTMQCLGRATRSLALPARGRGPVLRRVVAVARAKPEKSTDQALQGGLDPYLEVAVPKDQRPVNQLAELKADPLYSW